MDSPLSSFEVALVKASCFWLEGPPLAVPEDTPAHWLALLKHAAVHRTLGSVWAQLQKWHPEWTGRAEFAPFHHQWLQAAGLALVQQEHCQRLAFELQHQEIPHAFLKGAVYRHFYYPDPAWRFMQDVDLLVPHEQLATTGEVLRAAGFQRWHDNQRVGTKDSVDQAWINGPVTIDLHRHLVLPHQMNLASREIWEHVREYTHRGATMRGLRIEALLLHHVIHLARHGFYNLARVQWLVDFILLANEISRQGGWPRVLKLCEAWRVQRMLVGAMLCAKSACPAELLPSLPALDTAPRILSALLPGPHSFLSTGTAQPLRGLVRKMIFTDSPSMALKALASWLRHPPWPGGGFD